jgi:hypothetical protein
VYPESLVRTVVAASLMSNGKLYGAVTLDARYEVDKPTPALPKRTLKYGGRAIHRVLTTRKVGWLRSTPRRSRTQPQRNRVRWINRGKRFEAYQVTDTGTLIAGSRTWYGNRGGDLWLHSSKVGG